MSNERQNPYQLIHFEKFAKDALAVTSAEQLFFLARHIGNKMGHFSWESVDSLENLLKAIFTLSGPKGVVVAEIKEYPFPTSLEILVLWSKLINPGDEQTRLQALELVRLHEELRKQLRHSTDTLIHTYSPTKCHTVQQLQDSVPLKFPNAQSIRVLGSVSKAESTG